ncbi:MAG: APC family permease [Bryobacterales bacterium]|nr:APC family permease [Bryobacterales bacterium]
MSGQEQRSGFQRVLPLSGLVLFGITFVTPTAPFPMYGIVSTASKGHMALAYLFAMAAMALTAVSYGRMASAFPVAGSAYSYARRTMHPWAGYLVGWTMLLDYVLMPLLSVIYMALTVGRFVPEVPRGAWLVLFAVAVTVMNLFGLKVTNRANFVMTAIMGATVVWFLAASAGALLHGVGGGVLLSAKPFYEPAHFSLGSVMGATSIATFSYLGFDGISTLAEDAFNPRRDIGRATVLVCLICGVLFILQAYVGQLVWPDVAAFPQTETAFLDVSRLVGGARLVGLVSFVLLVAGVASAVTGQASASRLLVGMGRDGLLPPRIFAYVHPRHSTPTYGILAMGLVTVAGGFLLSFQLAAEAVNFGALLGFMAVNGSVISHYFLRENRRRGADAVWNLMLPAGGFLVCLYVFANLSAAAKIIGSAWCAIGLGHAAVLTRGFRRGVDGALPAEASFSVDS